jgi:hypothetical protein
MSTATPQCPIPESRRIDSLLLTFERYGPSKRWPAPKWRRHQRPNWELSIAIRCAADLDRAIDLVARHEWMCFEPMIWLHADAYGHVCVEAITRRITIAGLADPTRLDPWTHDHLRRRLREFAVGRPQ